MPVYVYRVVKKGAAAEAEPPAVFEVRQSIHDAPLSAHPETGEPVERVLCVPHIARGQLGNSQIANAGMTKYKRTSDGTYERLAGSQGPARINPHDT